MKLVFGGAWQGKHDYVKKRFGAPAACECTEDGEPDLTAEVLFGYHRFVLGQVRRGEDPLAYIRDNAGSLAGKVIVCDDVSCGVVPMEAELRAWREAVGRSLALLSSMSDEVVRLFCGLDTRLK